MSTSRRIAKNFLSLSLAEVVVRLSGTALSIFAARLLGVTAFGELAFATAFISFFNIFADFGLTALGLRDIAQDKTRVGPYGSTILLLQVALSLGLVVLIGIVTFFLPLSLREKAMVILFGLTLIPAAINMAYIFQAYEKMEFVAYSRIAGQLLYVILGFGLLWWLRDVIVLPLASTAGLALAAILLWWWLAAKRMFKWELMSWVGVRLLLRQTLPFLITAIAVQIYYNFDSIMLQFIKGTQVVGWYGSAYKIVLLVIMIGSLVHGALFPLISLAATKDKVGFERAIKEWARISGMLSWPIAVGGFLLSAPIITLLFGSKFQPASQALSILIWLPVLIFINGVMGAPLVAIGRQKENTIAVVIGAVVNLGLNMVLIPRYGMAGAATATIAAEAVVLIYLWREFQRHIGILIWQLYVIKPLLASACMGVVLAIIAGRWPVVIEILLGGVVYAAVMVAIRGVTINELRLLAKKPDSAALP